MQTDASDKGSVNGIQKHARAAGGEGRGTRSGVMRCAAPNLELRSCGEYAFGAASKAGNGADCGLRGKCGAAISGDGGSCEGCWGGVDGGGVME